MNKHNIELIFKNQLETNADMLYYMIKHNAFSYQAFKHPSHDLDGLNQLLKIYHLEDDRHQLPVFSLLQN